MIIKNGTLALEGGLLRADLQIDGERISRIGKIQCRGEKTIDAKGMLVFAGFIDAHVHLRDPEDTRKEDFSSGTAAALAGGITSVIDMPNYRNPPTTTAAALLEKKEIARKKARCNYSFHFGAAENNFGEVKKANPNSLKVFLSDTKSELWVKSDAALRMHLEGFGRQKPVLVHAEDAKTIAEQNERGIAASLEGIRRAGSIASEIGRKIHFCHLSSGQEIAAAKRYGADVTCEITPHHLFLCSSDAQKNPYDTMNPPLRSKAQVNGLWEALCEADIIATDHAPHTPEDKRQGAAGVPGLETSVALMLDAASKRRISYGRISQLMCANPARIFGIKERGVLKEGNFADITIADPKEKWAVKADSFESKCGWSPYEGMELKGRVKITLANGKIAFEDGQVIARQGSAKELERGN